MNPLKKIICLLALAIIIPSGFSVEAADSRLAGPVKTLADNIAQQFGAPEVRIAAIQGSQVYLNAGRNKFIREGTVYQIVADDVPFNDPVSRRRLGNIEIKVAEVQVETVRADYSIARVLDYGGEIDLAVGQRAVPHQEKFSIAVIPFEYLNSLDQTTPKIVQELTAAELIRTGLFVVAATSKTIEAAEMLQPDSPGTVQFSRNIGRMLGVDYVLYGFLIDHPGYMEIQCRVHNTVDGVGIATTTVKVEADFADQHQ